MELPYDSSSRRNSWSGKSQKVQFSRYKWKKSSNDQTTTSSSSSSGSSSSLVSRKRTNTRDERDDAKKAAPALKRKNYGVKYSRTTREVLSSKDDLDRFWHQLAHIDLKDLTAAFCGTTNCAILKRDHPTVFDDIKKVAEEVISNRKLLNETELRRRANDLFGEKCESVNHINLKSFVHSVLDDVFVLKKGGKFSSAIPLKWRRINVHVGAYTCMELPPEANNLETLYDNSMLGSGTVGVFGAVDVPNAVKTPVRAEIRERILRLMKLLVCDLIRTVLKSEVGENGQKKNIRRYYYDGEFDIPINSRRTSNESNACGPSSYDFPSSNPVQLVKGSAEVENSHWIHETEHGKGVNPLTPAYALRFEKNDLARERFPILLDNVAQVIPASVKMTIEKKKKMAEESRL